MMAEIFAPAKINLTLHVTGQRADGYHFLDSLVAFVDVGDTVRATQGDGFTVTGPRAAGVPVDDSNLVMKAAKVMGAGEVTLELEKHLPTASGIGGGSSDAAAACLAIAALTGAEVPGEGDLLSLGADLPVCMAAKPTRMSGIGEVLRPIPDLPPFHTVLVNSGAVVPTGAVYSGLSTKTGAPMPVDLPRWKDAAALALWLRSQRNDLEDPARIIASAIGVTLARLEATEGCLLARMSGSGATCFGIYDSRPMAEAAAQDIAEAHPEWWVRAASPYQRP